jgi:V/A-type H+-transporting ATPase subunit I
MAIEKMKFVSISGSADTLDAVTMRCLLSGSFQPETATELLSGKGYYRINEENPYAAYLARITDAVKSSGCQPVYDTKIVPDLKPGSSKSYYNAANFSESFDPESDLPPVEEIVASVVAKSSENELTPPSEKADKESPPKAKTVELDKLKYFEALDAETARLWAAKYLNMVFDLGNGSGERMTAAGDPMLMSYDKSLRMIENVMSALHDEKNKLKTECEKYQEATDQLKHFEALDIDFNELWSAKFLKLRFGRMPIASANEIDAYDKNPYVEFFRSSESNGYAWGMYVAPVSAVDEVDRIFAALSFERLRIPDITGHPADAIKHLTEEYNEAQVKIAELEKKIKLFWDAEYESCMRVCSKLYKLSEAFNLRRAAIRDRDGYLLFGWVPEKESKQLSASLSELRGVEVKIDSPHQVERFSPPTKLKNPWFMRPYEFLVSMFGMPSYDEFDPTPLVALTYTLFYGIMFADLGQGLILALIGWIMGRFMRNRLGPVLVCCGISGALFGLVFGSVFGYEHLLDGFYRKLGFDGKPIEVMESSSISTILISAIGIGVLLLIVAILLNIIISLRKAEYGAALFGTNGVAGLVLYVGLILLVLGFVIDIPVPTPVLVWLMIVLPCLLIMLGEPLGRLVAREKHWMPEKWGEYLVQGIFELFESILSYMTNTVSFIRVGAFVLVHAGMMMVFLTIAEMAGGGAAGVIVMVFGNLLVIALEGLLVGVQSLRLEYYELFSRFFAGTGKEFKPAGVPASKE